MKNLQQEVHELHQTTAEAIKKLDLAKLASKLEDSEKQMEQPDFWQDSHLAQATSKEVALLKQRIQPWQQLIKEIKELDDMAKLNDQSLQKELQTQFKDLNERFSKLKKDLRFNGRYDDHDVIISLYAGAGGTDAQDWAQMLLRMYVRWAEQHNVAVQTIEQTSGEEAGIKSATLRLSGASHLFGRLQGEHGVHRLVRLSPFNSGNLRQTSFAKIDILPVIDKPEEVIIDENDLKIDVFRAGGHGGQSVNTTDSAVRITHTPTGINVTIQNERSQLQNRETAMTIIRSRLAQLLLEQHQEKLEAIKGPNQSAEWGNQIRSYVLHPYTMVKDLRSRYQTSDAQSVLDGELDQFIEAYLDYSLGEPTD